jgi:hypothetical protein
MYQDTDEPSLRQQARAAIQSGSLPSRRQDRTMGGPGTGAFCALCHTALMRHMTELELHFDHVTDDIPQTSSFKISPQMLRGLAG